MKILKQVTSAAFFFKQIYFLLHYLVFFFLSKIKPQLTSALFFCVKRVGSNLIYGGRLATNEISFMQEKNYENYFLLYIILK